MVKVENRKRILAAFVALLVLLAGCYMVLPDNPGGDDGNEDDNVTEPDEPPEDDNETDTPEEPPEDGNESDGGEEEPPDDTCPENESASDS